LLERARASDPAAWDRLVRLYAPLIAHWCKRWSLQDADSADIIQDVLQAVAAHIDDFRKDRAGDTFRGWLRTITRNKVSDHFRRRVREPGAVGGTEAQHRAAELPEPDWDESDSRAEEAVEARLVRQTAESIRGEFEPRTWRAFWLTAAEGRPCVEVAAEMGLSPGAVRVAKSRVLRRLRDELGDLIG
jgi:RNA polymerase sigma-70 factor (ECF subfamily)